MRNLLLTVFAVGVAAMFLYEPATMLASSILQLFGIDESGLDWRDFILPLLHAIPMIVFFAILVWRGDSFFSAYENRRSNTAPASGLLQAEGELKKNIEQRLATSGPMPDSISQLMALGMKTIDPSAFNYYSAGAGDEITMKNNSSAFHRIRILPRVLVNVANVDTSVTSCGHKMPFPLWISPAALQKLAHPEGELAVSRAVASHNTGMLLSTWSNYSLEEVAQVANGRGWRWLQLFIYRDRSITQKLVARAEKAGFTGLVLTVDTPCGCQSCCNHRATLPDEMTLNNFGTETSAKEVIKYINTITDSTLCWDSIDWLRKHTSLPIIVKGVLSPLDAVLAVEAGVDGIIVSNHGGRQLDTVPATIEALPHIIKAVNGRVDVMLDGGIRSAADAFKALAMGAKAVGIGRPALWALAAGGEEGVSKFLELFERDFRLVLAMSGNPIASKIPREAVVVKDPLHLPHQIPVMGACHE